MSELDRILEFLGSIDADFGYAVGNLNMDTTPENRKEIIAALHRLILKERRDNLQSIVVIAKEHSDVIIQADGWPIMSRIRQLDAEIEGSNHG